jgi:hypothetical protein
VCARVARPAWVPGPSTSPLESAAKTRLETHEELGAKTEDPSLGRVPVRARTMGRATGSAGVHVVGLRSAFRARTVASMGASSNNRWSARAVSFGEARCVSKAWIKCLCLASQRPRDAQLHR